MDSAQNKNITETQLVHLGAGKVSGVIVNSHTSGTMKLQDGVDDTAGAYATGTLTISGGNIVYAVFAENTLTSDATNNTEDETVTIGSIVYRWRDTLAQAYDVKIGASAAASLDNLKAAINASGTAGVEYYAGTEAHPDVVATTNTDTTQVVVSKVIGTTNNTLATTETGAHLSWADTTLGGGTGASVTGVAPASSTFVIDGESYYFTNQLSEDVDTAVANEILWVTNDATALDNMKSAINGSGTEGTDYSTGTNAHPTVIATTNAAAAQTVQAKVFGTLGNEIATTETGDNMAWGSATLTGGTDAARTMVNTYTFASGSQTISFPQPLAFKNGLFYSTGGTTQDVTVVYNQFN